MKFSKIAIIGGGNLGSSIGKGILSIDNFSDKNLVICEKRKQRIKYLEEIGFTIIDSSIELAVEDAEIVIVSVKPQQFIKLLEDLKPNLRAGQILVSTVTGVTLNEIESLLGNHPVVRIMPNTAIEIKESMTCMSFNNTNQKQEERIMYLFNQLGEAMIVQEDLLDAVL
jgi:pyrroline-5-carboxylate reductase